MVTTRQAAIDRRSDALAAAVDAARDQLIAWQQEARHYRRWDVPERVRKGLVVAKRNLVIAEETYREHGERHRAGRPARTEQAVFTRGVRR